MIRRRLDTELVRRRLAESRTAAQGLIEAGRVTVSGTPATKSATQVEDSAAIEIKPAEEHEWVSRGAHKLLGALAAFEGMIPSISGQHCLDAGASTGGFTEVLLHEGAASVVAVDVGYGQIAWKLRNDPRVTVLERTNIRHLDPAQVVDKEGRPPTLVVSDLSFISLTNVVDNLVRCAPDAIQILMVKPQFEVGKGRVGAGGVVRRSDLRIEAVLRVSSFASECGLSVCGVAASPLPGPAGNVEYFLLLSPSSRLAADRQDGTHRVFSKEVTSDRGMHLGASPDNGGLKAVTDLEAAVTAAVQNGPQKGVTEPR